MKSKVFRAAQLAGVFALGLWAGGRWCAADVRVEDPAPAVAAVTDRRDRSHPLPSELARSAVLRAIEEPGAAPLQPVAERLKQQLGQQPEQPAGCHPRISAEPPGTPRSGRGTRKLQLEMINDCDDAVTTSWVDYEGKEQSPSVVLPGARFINNTWESHVFRLRLGDRKRSFLRDVVAPRADKARISFCGCTAEGKTALNDDFEILDAGGAASTDPAVPQCRVPFNPEPIATTASQTLGPRYPLVFRNSCTATKVRVDWVQFDGGLRSTAEVGPGEQFEQTSFIGHQWRVRDANTGRWMRDFALDGGSVVDLCSCD